MDRRMPLGAAACALALAAPLSALAQNGTENYYYPPSIKTFGKSSIPIAGPGKVVVKVLVKSDGSFTVSGIITSTNPADNQTALDIAKNSTYKPAARGLAKKPLTAYYDFTVNFTATGASGDAPAGALGGPEAEMRAGKYADAQTALTSYLDAHPGDQKALVDLGVTQVFQNDFTSAAATFDKVTTIPDAEKSVAVKAYSEAASAATKANQGTQAVADAKKLVELAPGPYASNTLGTAEAAAGDTADAVTDLEKARSEASSLKAADRVAIDLNLLSVLYAAGKDDEAKTVAAEIATLDPGNAGLRNVTANHYIKLAQAADTTEKYDAAEAAWEQAAQNAPPTSAAGLYAHAAVDELNKKTGSSLDKAKGYADKALAADPNNAIGNYAEGYVLAKQGKKSDALTYLNRADASAKASNDSSLTASIETLIKQVNGS